MVSYYKDSSGVITQGSSRAKRIIEPFVAIVGKQYQRRVNEDENYRYTYTRSGVLETISPKSEAQKHQDFLRTVEYQVTTTRSGKVESRRRITPLSDYEIWLKQQEELKKNEMNK